MNKVSEILDYGLLSEMAYLKLEDDRFKENNKYIGVPIGEYRLSEQGSLRKKDDVISFLNTQYKNGDNEDEENKLTDQEYKDLTDIDRSQKRDEIMVKLLDKFTIIDFVSDGGLFGSDFQATLFKSNYEKEYIISFRGTSSVKDIFIDLSLANLSMAHNFQLNEATDFITAMIKKYKISDDSLRFTGHSLGGIIAQYLGSKLKVPSIVFNPLGTSTLENGLKVSFLIELLEKIGIAHSVDKEWINKNILTISYNDIGSLNGDILSNIATKINISNHIGMKIDIFGKDLSIGGGHSIITLNKLLELQKDKNLTTIDDIKEYNEKQRTIFFEIMIKEQVDILAYIPGNTKTTLAIQTNNSLFESINDSDSLVKNLSGKNIKKVLINANIEEVENKYNFCNKLYYNFEKNKLTMKVKDFEEAGKLSHIFIKGNDNLKKYDIMIAIQGEEDYYA